jgi:heat shock protein HslJ
MRSRAQQPPGTRRRPGVPLLGGLAMLTVISALLVGCGEAGPAVDAPGGELGGGWVLLEGEGPRGEVPVLDGAPVTLEIDGTDWAGTAACNHYGATVEIDGGRVEVTQMIQTEMACEPDVMVSEEAYPASPAEVTAYERTGERLVLSGDGVRLVFDVVESEEEPALVGTDWLLDSLVVGQGADGAVSQATHDAVLLMDEDGRFDATTGCRNLAGSWESDGTTIRFEVDDRDDVDCPDEVAVQDDHVLAVLDGEVEAAQEGRTLQLSGPQRGLVYRSRG